MMVKEALAALGGRATRREIREWVQKNHPGTKANTIGCQTTICTVNNPVRVQFTQNKKPRSIRCRYDFLYRKPDGKLVWYSPKHHGLWTIISGTGGTLSIHRKAQGSAALPPKPQLQILFCGTPKENKDYAYLSDMAEHGGSMRWPTVKSAHAGDRVLFYTIQERRAFMASGWLLKDPKATNDPDDCPYRARVGAIRLLGKPVSIDLIIQAFPRWGWPRARRNITTVPERIADRLWSLIHRRGRCTPASPPTSGTDLGHRPKTGGGFGDTATNKLVEEAAIAFVKRRLRGLGFSVRSREKEKIGYDLDATKGKQRLHVEVKGVSGSGMTFLITQNEVATARCDPLFRLYLVNRARSKAPVLTDTLGRHFDKSFRLDPVSYFATKR